MKEIIYLQVRENGEVYGVSETEHTDFPLVYDFKNSNITYEYFKDHFFSKYKLIEGQLIEELTNSKEEELEELKIKRDWLFTNYIDRSPMWYQRLSDEQTHELELWYQAWCDMPEAFANGTWVEPTLPDWL